MSLHGTAFQDVGQYNELLAAVIKALPKGTSRFNSLALLGTLQKKGEEFERGLSKLFKDLLGGKNGDWSMGRVLDLNIYSAETAKEALKEPCFELGFGLGKELDSIDFQPIERKIKLVTRTVAELGFSYPPCRREIFEEAARQGYDICPREIGLLARLQYRDQPPGEMLYVAMEEIVVKWDQRGVFCLSHGQHHDKLELYVHCCGPGTAHLGSVKWLFMKSV